MFEESTSLLVAAGPESTSRLRSTTQLRRGVDSGTSLAKLHSDEMEIYLNSNQEIVRLT